MGTRSDKLRRAKANKNDEFYTRLEDIEAEILREDYIRQFQGKTVYCNCDDPEWSNFFVFFTSHFRDLGLKKLITTHYIPPIVETEERPVLDKKGNPKKDKAGNVKTETVVVKETIIPSYKTEWDGETLVKTPLKGSGDFRSDECVEILKEADIVATNPPFSLYREFVRQLVDYEKQYIIIGGVNSITYKEIFPLFRDGKMRFGYNACRGRMYFATTLDDNHIDATTIGVPAYWFTNLNIDKFNEPLVLTKNYYGNEENYPKYDNYDAIECSKVKDIPKDYYGVMGVPVSFMGRWNPSQFQILGADEAEGIGCSNGLYIKNSKFKQCYCNGRKVFKRIFIQRFQ